MADKKVKVTHINADTGPKPKGGYSQAVLIQHPVRTLFISGQIPETSSGEVPKDFESQCRLVWSNVLAQLEAAEMSVEDLAKVTILLSSREYAHANSRIRQETLGEHRPALTIIMAKIFDENWLLEVEAVAVK